LVGGALTDRSSSAMCDYSSRLARVGDKLITTQFWDTATHGFSPVGEPKVAVSLLPGTEVVFDREVQHQVAGFRLRLFKKEAGQFRHKVARVRLVNVDNPYTHHGAIEFPDGQIMLLTHLCLGQHLTVLQLPAQATSPAEAQGKACVTHCANDLGVGRHGL
jgi:hypothetical protein